MNRAPRRYRIVVWMSVCPTIGPSSEPSPIASTQSEGYRLIAGLATATFAAPIAPLLIIGITDSRHMSVLSDDVYRFNPVRLGSSDTAIVHGIDERVSLDNFRGMLTFYQQMLVGGSGKMLPQQSTTSSELDE